MSETSINPALLDQLEKLQKKYAVMGQDLSSYLDGLLYSDYLTYWDYIHTDTLLSLQNPKTRFPDETIFIIYHQITELYFKLILLEIEQISSCTVVDEDIFINRIGRIVRYFQQLEKSFDIMTSGMEQEQFLKFRMSLLPASGFQSAQYRVIELRSTDISNLVSENRRNELSINNSTEDILERLYWRSGATELASGKKTLTLQQFEEKYMTMFKYEGETYIHKNILRVYEDNFKTSSRNAEIKNKLREYDELANVKWRLAHLRSASRYLQKKPEDIKATGGTNWQKYLPPRFQRIMFFPQLWTEEEKINWGKIVFEK